MNQHTIPTGSDAGPGRNITSTLRANQKMGEEWIPEGPFDRFAAVNALKRNGTRFPALMGEWKWTPARIQHLEMLVSMTQEQDWRDGKPIVWMSVQETAAKLGVTPSVVNDNERALVALGAACFNDSGNYRRYGWRDERGRIVEAYGINLSPLVALKDYLEGMEKMVTEEWQERKRAKNAYSAVRRYLGRLLVSEQDNSVCLEGAKGEFEALVADMKSRHNTPLDDFQRWGAILGHFKVRLESMLDEAEPSDQKHPALAPVDNSQNSAKMLGKTRCTQGENPMPVSDKHDTHRIHTTNTLKKDISNGAGAEPPPSTAAMSKGCPEGGSSEVEASPPKQSGERGMPRVPMGQYLDQCQRELTPVVRETVRQREDKASAGDEPPPRERSGGGLKPTKRMLPPITQRQMMQQGQDASAGDEPPAPKRIGAAMPMKTLLPPIVQRQMMRQGQGASAGDEPAPPKGNGGDLYLGEGVADKFNLDRFVNYCLPTYMRKELPEKPDWDSVITLARAIAVKSGVSRPLWEDAVAIMGEALAAICMLIVEAKYQIGDVGWRGGYLRGMLKAYNKGELHIMPTIYGLDTEFRNEEDE